MENIYLLFLWCLWCAVHSAMISVTVTNFLKKILRNNFRFYRLFYNHVAFITFLPLFRYSSHLKSKLLFRWEDHWIIVQILLLVTALFLFIAGTKKYDMLQFLGLRQLKSGKSLSTLSKSGNLDISGIIGITRHPWYLGAIIFIWVFYREMFISTFIVNIILTIYLIIGTILEERKLAIEWGEKYREYQMNVSMLFPYKWLHSLFSGTNNY